MKNKKEKTEKGKGKRKDRAKTVHEKTKRKIAQKTIQNENRKCAQQVQREVESCTTRKLSEVVGIKSTGFKFECLIVQYFLKHRKRRKI